MIQIALVLIFFPRHLLISTVGEGLMGWIDFLFQIEECGRSLRNQNWPGKGEQE